MKLYVPSHTEVKNIGLCIGQFDNTDPNDIFDHPWVKTIDSLHPYTLAISVSDMSVFVIFVSKDINECIRRGKLLIANIGDPIIDIHNDISHDIMTSFLERRIEMIQLESVEDAPINTATEELNNVVPEEERQKNFEEERMKKCKNCVHYLASYNLCRMACHDIRFVKGCTAYEPIYKK